MEITSRRIERLPPYIFSEVNLLKMKLRRQGVDIIDLGMGNPDQPTPGHIVDKLSEVVRDPRTHRYAPSSGIDALRNAICRHYKRRYDVDLDPETEAIVERYMAPGQVAARMRLLRAQQRVIISLRPERVVFRT